MKRVLALFGLFAAVAAIAKTSTPGGWIDDYDLALKRAAEEKKPIVANFSGSDWCGWCKKLDAQVFDTDAFRRGSTNRYVLLMVDSPHDKSLLSENAREQNPKLVKKYRITGFPTVLVLDEKGEVLAKLGYQKGGPKKYLKSLKSAVKEAPDMMKYIKPIEAVLNASDAAMQKDTEAALAEVYAKFAAQLSDKNLSDEARGKAFGEMRKRAEAVFCERIAPKYIPIYEKAFATARAMPVPEHMEAKKAALIDKQERMFKEMKRMVSKCEESNKSAASAKAE